MAPTRRRRSWLTSGGGTPSLSAERDSHAGTSGSVSEGSEGAPAVAPPKKRRRPGADASNAGFESRLDKHSGYKQQLSRAAGPQSGSAAFDSMAGVDGASQLSLDGDLAALQPLSTGLFPDAAGIGKRQASLSGWLPDRESPRAFRAELRLDAPQKVVDRWLPVLWELFRRVLPSRRHGRQIQSGTCRRCTAVFSGLVSLGRVGFNTSSPDLHMLRLCRGAT